MAYDTGLTREEAKRRGLCSEYRPDLDRYFTKDMAQPPRNAPAVLITNVDAIAKETLLADLSAMGSGEVIATDIVATEKTKKPKVTP